MSEGALEGLRILDLTQGVAGPYCTKLLSDYGADVIKIERTDGGDPARHAGPFPDDEPHPERSGLFLDLNTGKRSLTLNLKTESGQRILRRLAAWSDAVVENFRPGALARLGLSDEQLAEGNPAAALVSISNFGQHGPYRDFEADDMLLYAMGGGLAVTAYPGREPNRPWLYAPLFLAGAMAASYSLGAITASVRLRRGERVDISIQEMLACSLDRATQNVMAHSYGGELFVTEDCNLRASAFPNGVYGGQLPCKDGYVNFLCYPYWWDRFCRMVGREDLIDDTSYSDNLLDPEFGPQIDALIYPWLLERTKIEVMDAAQAQGVPVAALNTTEDLFADRQLRARGYFVELDHPETGPREYPGAQFKMSETPASIRRAPLLGEHTMEVLTGLLDYTPEDVSILRQRDVV
ncbi:MAG: CoA transferase [Chloroflexi bacterium]|nr:CoA transferase [Chloroflexota bacterium]